MIQSILGSKLSMTQTFQDGKKVGVTMVSMEPCIVTHIKSLSKDGYWAVQLGFGLKKIKNTTKPLQGHLSPSQKASGEQAKKVFPRYLREVRLDSEPEQKVGDEIKFTDIFAVGDTISVTGTSKGKGFAGGMKRWGFSGAGKTHGQSDRHRAPGSIGQGTTPGRVYKGKHMAGRMGSDTKTVKNLKVVSIDPEKNTALLSGAIPGRTGGLLIIKKLGGVQNV